MPSLYAKYLMERTNDHILEEVFGYLTYRYLENKTVYIVDLYIEPEFRRLGKASELADRVVAEAKEKGCVKLIGSVVPSMKNSTISTSVLFAYGMTLDSSSNNFILFKKDI